MIIETNPAKYSRRAFWRDANSTRLAMSLIVCIIYMG
jgi:hypothetical protein